MEIAKLPTLSPFGSIYKRGVGAVSLIVKMSNQTEKKGKMENPSASLPPRPPLSHALEKQPSFDEYGPKTMSARDLKLARV
ncbi:unnamed protein product [Lupinus luteus]|uniref:Uncharacterized protein n=1 Tax=Lupinus luteus TaxID=3873 RepID=A0AAV1XCN6_LUPLU